MYLPFETLFQLLFPTDSYFFKVYTVYDMNLLTSTYVGIACHHQKFSINCKNCVTRRNKFDKSRVPIGFEIDFKIE